MCRTYSPNGQHWNSELTEWKVTWKKIRGKTTAKMGRRQDKHFIARGLKRMEKTHWVGTTEGELLMIPGPDTNCRAIEEEEEEKKEDYFKSC
jgi:hypothetical protein